MLRKVRPIQLVRALLLGAAISTASLAGCTDPNDPLTYVEEIKDQAKQPGAVKRLKQFYEDAMTKDKKDRAGANVKPLLDKIAEPLTKACVEGDLQPRVRSELIALLADFRDPRTEPCLKKALEEYKPDQNEDDIRNVMRTVAAMKQKSLAPQVMKTFMTMKYSSAKVKLIHKDVVAAVMAVADKSFEDDLIKLLEPPIDASNEAAVHDQAFWHTVACRALGEIKSDKAVKPLLKVLLTPSKGVAPIPNTALVALVKIGKPAVGPTEALLKGEDQELVKYSTTENLRGIEKEKDAKAVEQAKKLAEKAHISMAAQILGALSAQSSVQPLLSAREKADDASKAVIAVNLSNLPRSAETVEAYKKTFEEVKMDLALPNGKNAKEALVGDPAALFYDAALVPWLVETTMGLKGEAADVAAIRETALVACAKLMKPDQVSEVEKLYTAEAQGTDAAGKPAKTTVGKAFEKEWTQVTELLKNCKEDLNCYHAKLTDDKTQGKDAQFTGIKAAYMIGILGADADRAKLVDAMPKLTNEAVMYSAMNSLLALSPKGDTATADKMMAYLDKAEELKDEALVQRYRDFPLVAAKLRARSQ